MTKAISNPRLADVKELSKTSATFVIEPLYTGYGHTLGNSLRRVLLSSIEGAAIVAFRIEGATHEFTTLPGIKEDVVEIMLNLKNVGLRSFSDAPVELSIEKKGSGVVTAADIKANADVEIVNPDALIATIDDPKGKIKIDIVVDRGRGYRKIEESLESRLHGDMIALDAMFTPVTRVRYKVESTRVRQIADLDKLSLTVDTDGTITPKEAFEEAAAILVNQYQALAGSTKAESAPPLGKPVNEEDSMLNLPIEELNLSARATNSLTNGGITTIGDLVSAYNSSELENLKGFGETALNEVSKRLSEMEF